MNRQPVYHLDRQLRIISCPNGQWVAQQLEGLPGDNCNDPWQSLHKPTSKAAAYEYMYMKSPVANPPQLPK